jgi:Na+/H+ antiporter NhaC
VIEKDLLGKQYAKVEN